MLWLKSKRGERMLWGVGMAGVGTTGWRCWWVALGVSQSLEPGLLARHRLTPQ